MLPHPKDTHMPTPFRLPTPAKGWQPITLRPLRVLVSPIDGGLYVGRCVEHDITVQGSTFEAIVDALTHVLLTQCIMDQSAGVEMLSTLKAAPENVWTAWDTALPQFMPSSSVKVSLMKKEARLKFDLALVQGAKAA